MFTPQRRRFLRLKTEQEAFAAYNSLTALRGENPIAEQRTAELDRLGKLPTESLQHLAQQNRETFQGLLQNVRFKTSGFGNFIRNFSKKSNLSAKQKSQLGETKLVGKNPGNIELDKKGRLRADTELLGGEQGALQKFKELTGEIIPDGVETLNRYTPDGNLVVYRQLGKSGHSKIEITRKLQDGRTFIEKITFK